ncbi:hypothetical protein ACFPRL_24070 [Pseudoclavibacter helvolus]
MSGECVNHDSLALSELRHGAHFSDRRRNIEGVEHCHVVGAT